MASLIAICPLGQRDSNGWVANLIGGSRRQWHIWHEETGKRTKIMEKMLEIKKKHNFWIMKLALMDNGSTWAQGFN